MNTAKQELLEKKRLSKIITVWADKNKKVFWKYEVSSFYKTYVLKISNLPEPSGNDILLSANKNLLNTQQRTQLCDVLTKACSNSSAFNYSTIDVQIGCDNGIVTAQVL